MLKSREKRWYQPSEKVYFLGFISLSWLVKNVMVPLRKSITGETRLVATRKIMRGMFPSPDREPKNVDISIVKIGKVLVYRFKPKNLEGPVIPTMVFFHGGGFAFNQVRYEYNLPLIKLCEMLNVQIYSPEYRLAPENPHPAQFNDCYYTTKEILRRKSYYQEVRIKLFDKFFLSRKIYIFSNIQRASIRVANLRFRFFLRSKSI